MNKKNKILSIRVINYFLFLAILYNSLLFFISENLRKYDIYFFLMNLLLLIIFFLINKLYEKDYMQSKKYMKILNNNSIGNGNFNDEQLIKNALKGELKFKENKDLFNYFKYSVIKNNLLKKDYNDLENVLLKFTPEAFLREIGKKGNEKIELGLSTEKEMHIMFLDIIGFTKISEKLKPERTLKILNIYFDGIVEIVKKNNGYVDKFLGDGMMIIFKDRYSDNVINTAIEIEDYIDNLNFNGENKRISIGIGINGGNIIVGTIGSKNRMEITVIGDVVNTAAKLEGESRKYKYKIIISENTYMRLKNKKKFDIDEIGKKTIKGRKNKIRIYGINC